MLRFRYKINSIKKIDVLKQTKITSADIAIRLNKNEETEKSLNLARQKYAAIAIRASILYFTVQNLTSLNVMYQFSLSWFYSVFQSCLSGKRAINTPIPDAEKKKVSITIGGESLDASMSKATNSNMIANSTATSSGVGSKLRRASSQSNHEPSNSLQETSFQSYVDTILDFLTHTVYQVVSWALFAEHQLIFSFSVCVNILKHPLNSTEQKISTKENNFFLISALLGKWV